MSFLRNGRKIHSRPYYNKYRICIKAYDNNLVISSLWSQEKYLPAFCTEKVHSPLSSDILWAHSWCLDVFTLWWARKLTCGIGKVTGSVLWLVCVWGGWRSGKDMEQSQKIGTTKLDRVLALWPQVTHSASISMFVKWSSSQRCCSPSSGLYSVDTVPWCSRSRNRSPLRTTDLWEPSMGRGCLKGAVDLTRGRQSLWE